MSDSSDIEIQSALLEKKTKMPKPPRSPSEDILNAEPKRPPTKIMIHEALVELRKGTRKGSSLYAIKKFIAEKHHVDTEKINYIIKKLIKSGVESGTIQQTKGIGASGSFRLAMVKNVKDGEKTKKKPKNMEKPTKNSEKTTKNDEKMMKNAEKNTKKSGNKTKKSEKTTKNPKITEKSDSKKRKFEKEDKIDETKKKIMKKSNSLKSPKVAKEKKEGPAKEKIEKKKKKMAKEAQTPAKKRAAMLKRKSIGSIIKAPKMRPKMKS